MPEPSSITPQFPPGVNDLEERFYAALSEEPVGEEALADTVYALRAEVESRKETLRRTDYLRARAIFETVEDVLDLFWSFSLEEPAEDDADDEKGATLFAHPPDLTEPGERTMQEMKERIQSALTTARDEQLQTESTRSFIDEMEKNRPHSSNGRKVQDVSVQNLFLSPQSLSEDLRNFERASVPEKLGMLDDIIQPYLQFVDSDANDAFTGLRLLDIWRYARHTWSIPHKQTPGRRMRYLVRDAARDFHPIIGIGALGSGVMQLTPRDKEIGWAPIALAHRSRMKDHFEDELGEPYSDERALDVRLDDFQRVFGPNTTLVLHALLRQIQKAVDYLYVDDFLEQGILTPGDLHAPSCDTINRIEKAKNKLKNANSNREFTSSDDLEEDAQSSLYSRKRATSLKRLLKAKRILLEFTRQTHGLDDDALRERIVSQKRIRGALKTALRSVKKRRIAGLMDITTCGAIPPYNEILGGKLVSFLMGSPQVISEYRERYKDQESVIASRMKGEPVTRRPDLVLLSTTSLYAVGSSQYNRLDAPTANGNLEYIHIGESSGHGHIHISQRTFSTLVDLLDELAKQNDDIERPSNRFGNGVNYRMRTIKAALSQIGLQPLHQHEQPRLIYLVPLAENWREYLTGKDDDPEYIYADTEEDPRPETQALIDFWKLRWFYKRAQKDMIIERIEDMDGKVKVSDLIPDDEDRKTSAPLFEEEAA
jgi:hypothetical protein